MSSLRTTLCALGAAALVVAIGGPARASDGGGDGAATQCGGVSYVGCCDGTTLRYCASGQLVDKLCPNACGWNIAFALYGCSSSAGADPSGMQPRACPPAPDAGADSAPEAGSADGSADAIAQDAGAGCSAVPYVGCCDGDTLRFCAGNAVLALVCAAGSCGWNASRGFYGCDTAGGADPSATYAKSCAQVVGDAGLPDAPVPRDGAPDMPRDSAADALADGVPADADAAADVSGVDDGALDGDAPSGGSDAPGIDAVGFDGAARDSGTSGSGEGGCGCAAGGAGAAGGASTLCALALLLLWDRRRRRA